MKNKKILVYFACFLSLTFVFTAGYYFSYKTALEDFNKTADKRNDELILTLEENGLIIVEETSLGNSPNSSGNGSLDQEEGSTIDEVVVDAGDEQEVLSSTKYILQTYDVESGEQTEETLEVPSYLVGLNRGEVNTYLDTYMEDLPWNEFREGLSAYELLLFSDKEIIIRKTYNPNLVQYEFFIKAIDNIIVVFYSDQKTVYEYTNMSINDLNEEEKSEVEEGYFVKDLDELYSILENYTS